MTHWQRRLRLAVAAFGLILAIVVFLAIDRRPPAPPPVTPTRLDPSAQTEIEKGEIRSTKGSKNDFKVSFDHSFGYSNGVTRFRGVTVNVDDRGGRSFVLKGREAEVGPNNEWAKVTGEVRLTASDGLTCETDEASWNEKEDIVRAPGRVTFARGRMSGSGVGMTYDKTRDVLWLLDQARVTMTPDAKGGGALDIDAGAAGIARADKYVKFVRSVKLVRDGRVIEADEATAHLTDDEKHVRLLELRGNSRITPTAGAPGSLQQMTAADMNLTYAPDSDVLQEAALSGRSAIQLAGEGGGRGSHIAAETITVAVAPDGTTVTSLAARDNVQTDFAADRAQTARSVRSATLDGRGEPGRGLTAATFGGNVEFHETVPGTPPVERTVRARTLEAVLNPSTAAIEQGTFSGGVRFEENKMTATAAVARYVLAQGVVDLSGVEGTARPVVADEHIRVESRTIQLKPEGRHLVATADVRSTIQPAEKKPDPKAPPKAGTETHVPGILAQNEAVSVTADRLEYDGATSTAVYTGNARLWQGETAINGNTVSLDNTRGDLTASGGVRTTWASTDTSQGRGSTPASAAAPEPARLPNSAAAAEPNQTLATAEDMRYEDALRRVTYTTKAHVVGAQGDVTAVKVELYLAQANNDLERVEAYDDVTVKVDKRIATGARMTYFAADERYLMNGSPVKIVDECGTETIARTLEFFKSTDTIVVNGVQKRAETKKNGKCP